MSDQKSVDIGGEAKTLASTIRDINQSLYLPDTLYKADAITPVRGRTYTLLFGLREKLKASGPTPEIFEQVKNAIKSWRHFTILPCNWRTYPTAWRETRVCKSVASLSPSGEIVAGACSTSVIRFHGTWIH